MVGIARIPTILCLNVYRMIFVLWQQAFMNIDGES